MDNKTQVKVIAPRFGKATLIIKGTSSLICNRLPGNVAQDIEDKKTGKSVGTKSQVKTPEERYKDSMYIIDEKKEIYGYPISAFKKGAEKMAKGKNFWQGDITGKRFNAAVQFLGDLAILSGDKPKIRKDVVLQQRVPAIAYRAEFKEWGCEIVVQWNTGLMSIDEICAIVNAAGFGIGIGSWRPELNGNHGMYEVANVLPGKVDTLSGKTESG